MKISTYIILIPLIPLIGFFINGLIALQQSRGQGFVSKGTTSVIACLASLLSFILVLCAGGTLITHPATP
ncbi:MAG TPA: hypothetical protein VJC18_11790 [bacterium]|nr:hypothetical protein [bacterium]